MDAQHSVERDIALDLVRRGLPVAPLIVLAAGLLRGWDGAASGAIAVAIVFANFLAAAWVMARVADNRPAAVGVAAVVGYVVRLAVIVVALLLLRHRSFVDLPTLGFVLVGTHLGLLFWEARYVSITLAAPGLHPGRPVTSGDQ